MKLITELSQNLELSESKSQGMSIEGIFSTAGVKNSNGRTYPKTLLEREIGKIMPKVQNKKLWGELSHPAGPETDPSRIAILTTELAWKNEHVYGRAKVLDTPMGAIAKTLIKEGKLGISSRGLGTVGTDGTINEDFNLLTYDLVCDPSNSDSYVNGIYEGKEFFITDPAVQRLYDNLSKVSKDLFHWERGAFSSPMQESKLPMKALDFYFKNESSPYTSHMSWTMWWGKVRQIWVDRESKQVLASRNMKFKPGTVIGEGDIAKLTNRDWQVNMVPKDNDKKYKMYLRETRELTADNFLLPHEQEGKWSIFENNNGEIIFARWDTEDQIAVQFENGDEKYFQSMQEFINFIKGVYSLVGVAPDEEVEQERK